MAKRTRKILQPEDIAYRAVLDAMADFELEDEYAKLRNQVAELQRKQELVFLELLHRLR